MIHFPSLPSFLQLQPHQTSLDSCSAVVSPPLGRALGPLHLFLKTFNNPVHLANFHHPYLSLSITLSDSRLNQVPCYVSQSPLFSSEHFSYSQLFKNARKGKEICMYERNQEEASVDKKMKAFQMSSSTQVPDIF